MASVSPVKLQVNTQAVEIRFSWWEKTLGLLGNVTVPRSQISDVRVVDDPMGLAMRSGMKAGLRLPGVIYLARTIRLDELFAVRRNIPALSFAVGGEGKLRRVIVSTPDAQKLAKQLRASA
jgi:hypothetical protein